MRPSLLLTNLGRTCSPRGKLQFTVFAMSWYISCCGTWYAKTRFAEVLTLDISGSVLQKAPPAGFRSSALAQVIH